MAKPTKKEIAAAALRHHRFVSAGIIRDRFPSVESIILRETWRDPDHRRDDEMPKEHVRGPDGSASYDVDCRNRECVGGGIDLNRELADMISKGETVRRGHAQCRGWQDAERVGQYTCLMHLEYIFEVTYRDEDGKPN